MALCLKFTNRNQVSTVHSFCVFRAFEKYLQMIIFLEKSQTLFLQIYLDILKSAWNFLPYIFSIYCTKVAMGSKFI